MVQVKHCFVPACESNSHDHESKIFFNVPRVKRIRRKWMVAANRDPKSVSLKTVFHCCEDHFDVKNDMENYMRYVITKGGIRPFLKTGVVPHLFECQKGKLFAANNYVDEERDVKPLQEEISVIGPTIVLPFEGQIFSLNPMEPVKPCQTSDASTNTDTFKRSFNKSTQSCLSNRGFLSDKSTFVCGVMRKSKATQCCLLQDDASITVSTLKRPIKLQRYRIVSASHHSW